MRRTDLWGYVVAVLVAAGAKGCYDHGQREQGALRERLRAADSTAKALAVSVRRVDTVYRRDTLRLTRALTRWDTVRAGVDTITDTVAVPVEVVRWVVASADSAVSACRSVVQTCEQRVAVRDSLLDVQRRQLAIMAKQRPGFVKRWGERAAWLAAGVVLGATR
jgi:hypothetical protein